MTRKQSISLAIQALAVDDGNTDAIGILSSISSELPLMHWTDASIRDSIEQFISDNGRAPTATDFKKACLPPHPQFMKHYNKTLGEWMGENYPPIKLSPERQTENDINAFIAEYERIKPSSAEQFNAERSPGTKGWMYIAKACGTTRWRTLLDVLNLTAYFDIATQRTPPKFKVTIYPHYDFRD